MKRILAISLAAAMLALGAQVSLATEFINIGTGGVTGVYYPTGGAICRLVNQHRDEHNIRCSVESTGGSVYNVKNVLAGELSFGIAQSDVQYKARNGEAPFDQPEKDLRAVFSIHPETAILVARDDSGLNKPQDMKGKRVNIGNPGSGTLATAEVVLDAYNISQDELGLAGNLRSGEHGDALRDNKIDAFFFLVGHPNGGLKDIFFSVDAHIVPLTGPGIDKVVANAPYYVHAETPGGIYRGVDQPVPTFAVKATFVTSAKVDDRVVYEVVKAVFGNLDAFKKLHPAYAHLTAEQMLQGLSAPLHDGAMKYFKEAGLK